MQDFVLQQYANPGVVYLQQVKHYPPSVHCYSYLLYAITQMMMTRYVTYTALSM